MNVINKKATKGRLFYFQNNHIMFERERGLLMSSDIF